jgi:aspartate-semialdehyde dehydrogenase
MELTPSIPTNGEAVKALGEGGELAEDGLTTTDTRGRKPVAIIGGTGYVGRLLARRLLSHPTFCLGPIVGSSASEGMLYKEVWERKEAALMKNYGSQLWTAMDFPPQLEGVRVSSLEQLRASDCRFAVSCVAPEVGYVEDLLVSSGFKVFSISPYKRMDNLMVLEVNPEQLVRNIDFPLFKSPNCVSVGTSIALKALSDAYGVVEASVCTFQSLSGRGDAMYPRELVQGNVYPVWGTKEHTEQWIHNEVAALPRLPAPLCPFCPRSAPLHLCRWRRCSAWRRGRSRCAPTASACTSATSSTCA